MSTRGLIFREPPQAVFAAISAVCQRSRWRIKVARADYLAGLFVLAWAGIVGAMAALKHLAFNSSAYDLAIYDQVLWNSAHGRLFEASVLAGSPVYLGHHFSPILLALVPLYWIWPSPLALVIVQAILLAMAGLPIYWLARDRLGNSTLPLALLLAYLLHPATAYIALFDFHGLALAAPLLSIALFLLMRHRFKLFGLALVCLFLVREDMGLVGAAIGIYVMVVQRRRFFGLLLAVAGMVWTLVLIGYVIPDFNANRQYPYMSFYADSGTALRDVLASLLHDPGFLIRQALTPGKLAYLPQLLGPVAGLALLGLPALIVALPTLASVLLANSVPAALIRYQYSAPLLPPLFFASILGLAWLRERYKPRWPSLTRRLAGLLLVAALLCAYLYGPLPLARDFEAQTYQADPRLAGARALIAQIPPDASVVAQSGLVPQISHRSVVQIFAAADPALRPDYYLLDTNREAQRYPFAQGDDNAYLRALARVTGDAEYQMVGQQAGYLLFQRQVPNLGSPVGVTFGDQVTLVGGLFASEGAMAGGTVRVTTYWRAEKPLTANYSLFVHVLDGNGTLWGQHDDYPTGQYFPTSEWTPGRLYRADWSIAVSSNAPPGEYRVLVGLYDLATMQRLPITAGGSEPDVDSLTLGKALSLAAGQTTGRRMPQ